MESRDLVLGTAGHIDHGKTALVRALTGINTDRLPAERQRGITIDLGFAALNLGNHRIAMVDVPGHERFIRNMLAGATGLDLALLVVAADDSVMPQTREHLEILGLLGLSSGLIALSKCDLVDAGWLDLVEEDLRGMVAGTFLDGAKIVRTSATTGQGIEELKAALARLCDELPERSDAGLFRMAIDRSFTVAGHGTVVTGTVASGEVAVGDELQLWPEGRSVRVRGLQRHDRPVENLGRGSRAAINLGGVHHSEIRRGQELATPGYLDATRVLAVEVRASADAPRILRHRGRYKLHLGTAEVLATLTLLGANELAPGESTIGQLFVAEPVVAVGGQPFVLRAESPSATLGGGRVLQPLSRRLRRRDAPTLSKIERLRSPIAVDRVSAALALRGLQPSTEAILSRDTGLDLDRVRTAMAELSASGEVVELPLGPRRSVRVLKEAATELEDRVLRALGRLHQARPRQSAIRRSHVAAALPDLESDALVLGILDRLSLAGKVIADDRTVALRGHEPRLSQAERRLKDQIYETFVRAGLSPPDLAELTSLCGSRAAVLPELLTLLVDEGRIVELGPGLYLSQAAETEMQGRVRQRLSDGSGMTMADLRDLLGTTRKFAVPFGEYLDRIGLTRRAGDVRYLASNVEVSSTP